MKVIISGGRNVSLGESGIAYLDEFFRTHSVDLVLNGYATGIDHSVEDYCKENGIPCKLYPAKWQDLKVKGCVIKQGKYSPYNANAGFARNMEMVQEALPDGILITFAGGHGTKHIHDYAVERGLTVIDLRSRGELVVKL